MNDRDKLKAAFAELRKLGWFARMDFWCCQTCGNAAAHEALEKKGISDDDAKVVFWHNQDDDSFREGEWRSWHKDGEKTKDLHATLYLSHTGPAYEVLGVLIKHGLKAFWNGEGHRRVEVYPSDTPAEDIEKFWATAA